MNDALVAAVVTNGGISSSPNVLTPVPVDVHWPSYRDSQIETTTLDHFVERDGKRFAGTHLIIDFWDAYRLDDLRWMEKGMIEAVRTAGATLLHIHLHHFTPNGGISGVAVLAESHLSVHTWPERGFAAFDVFMCGEAQPLKCLPVLERYFSPGKVHVGQLLRGIDRLEAHHEPFDFDLL